MNNKTNEEKDLNPNNLEIIVPGRASAGDC